MFLFLLIIFILVPTIEISLFIRVGDILGVWPTVGLTLLTAVVGASLVRSQGIQTITSAQSRLAEGQLPSREIIEGFLLIIAGVFLVTPGFMTDTLGMILLLPPARKALAAKLESQKINAMKGNPFQSYQGHQGQQSSSQQGQTFEGEFERKNDNDQNRLN